MGEFGKRLITLMEGRRMTIKAAAEAAGVAQSTLQRWREGSLPTNFNAVAQLSSALGVSFAYLMLGREENHPDKEEGSSRLRHIEDGIIVNETFEVRVRHIKKETKEEEKK